MSISRAMNELVEKVRELGVGEFFDGMDYDEIIEMGLYYYGKHIEAELEGIKEDMEIDSESVVTLVCSLCLRGTDCSCVQYPTDSEDEWLDNDLIEETGYLEEDE